MAQSGSYKDDHNVKTFQQAILSTRQHPKTITQYDTLLAQSIVDHNDVWTRQVTNPLTQVRIQQPLQTDITIMQIYHVQHYTKLLTDNDKYYHYDGLGIAVPNKASQLHDHLRLWYGDSIKPPVLRQTAPTVHTPYTPQQTTGWSCALHMLLTSL